MAVEDLQDDHGAVHDFAADLDFEVARLRRRDLVIDQDDVGAARFRIGGGLRRLLRPGRPALRRFAHASRWRRTGRVLRIGFVFHETAHLLPLAHTQIGGRVETVALLRERADHFESQRLGEVAQFVHGGLELDVAHACQLYGRHDGPLGFLLDFCCHLDSGSGRWAGDVAIGIRATPS